MEENKEQFGGRTRNRYSWPPRIDEPAKENDTGNNDIIENDKEAEGDEQ